MTYEEARQHIMEMYPKRLYITKIELCSLLDVSRTTLDRRLKKDSKLAKLAIKEEKKVLFAIPDIAKYLA